MKKLLAERRSRRCRRVRTRLSGMRLSVFRSNKHLYAQLIDGERTLASANTLQIGEKPSAEIALQIGKTLAAKALEQGITKTTFDRGWYAYHGLVAAVAEGARLGGLQL